MSKNGRNQRKAAKAAPVTAPGVEAAEPQNDEVQTEVIENGEGAGATVMTLPDGPQVEETNEEPARRKKAKRIVNGKSVPFARVFTDEANGVIAVIGATPGSVRDYLSGFKALSVRPTAGFDSFWGKVDGYSNPVTPYEATAHGTAKMIAVAFDNMARLINEGGDEGKAASDAMEGLLAYWTIALVEAKQAAEQKGLNEALATLTKAMGGDETAARAKLAQFATQTVAKPAQTPVSEAEQLEEATA